MQINNNVQSPNFGMALKISKGAKEALKECSMETISSLQKAGEDLKDTKFFHVKVNDNLSAEVTSDKNAYFGYFKTKDYVARRNGVQKVDGELVPDERIIMIDKMENGGTIAGVARYVPLGQTTPVYSVWNAVGPYAGVEDIKGLTKIAKLLDSAAVEKYEKGITKANMEKLEKEKISKTVDNLLDTFGV